MLRSIAAVLLGFVAWFVAATAGNWLIRTLLPGYTEVEAAMTFTLPMLLARLALGIVSSLCAGAACAAAAGASDRPVKVFAGIIVLMFLPVHYRLWATFPAWYHIVFIASLAPAVLAGGALLKRLTASRSD